MAENNLLEYATFNQSFAIDVLSKNQTGVLWKKATGIAALASLVISTELQEPNKDLLNSITNTEIVFSTINPSVIGQDEEFIYIDDAPIIPPVVFSMKVKLGEIRKLEFEPIEDENGFL